MFTYKQGHSRRARVTRYTICTLLPLCLYMVSAFAQQAIRLSLRNAPISEAFRQIEKQSDYRFLYDEQEIMAKKDINISTNAHLPEILRQLGELTALDFHVKGKYIVVRRKDNLRITGVVGGTKGEPLPFVTIRIKESNQQLQSNSNGHYHFQVPLHFNGTLTLQFHQMGRQAQVMELQFPLPNKVLDTLTMPELSIALEGIDIMAKRSFEGESNSSLLISRDVIEQSPSMSLNDLLNQIPGQKIAPPSLQQVQNVNLRTATLSTTDGRERDPFQLSNSFGISILMDGSPVSNNANMQTYNPGISGLGNSYVGIGDYGLIGSENRLDGYTGDYTFGGIDLRQIPTENIESVEIIAGVAPAKYGDLTDGAIVVNRIAGKSPLFARIQMRESATVYSLNKGIQTNKWGGFSFGASYTDSYQDNRDKLKSYKRITGNLMWTSTAGKDKRFSNTMGLDYGRNLDGVRRDADDPTRAIVKYTNNNFAFSNRNSYRLDGSFLNNISSNVRISRNYQRTYREQDKSDPYIVYTPSTEVGITEGEFSTGTYTAVTDIEGVPIDISARLELNGRARTWNIGHNISFGTTFSYSANRGRGQIVDPSRPWVNRTVSNVDNRSERYYDFNLAHAQKIYGFYVEDLFHAPLWGHTMEVRIGGRMDKTASFTTFSPRTNINYAISDKLRLGLAYGISSKAPGLAHIYPGPIFYEIPLLMVAGTTDGSVDARNSVYLVYVDKYTPDNSSLKPSSSQQFETTLQYRNQGYNVSLAAYWKENKNSFSSKYGLDVVTLPTYELTGYAEDGTPQYTTNGQRNYRLSRYEIVNGGSSSNTGLELLLSTPKFQSIQTSFTARAGLTRSTYTPLQNRRGFTNTTDNVDYAIIGIYPTNKRVTWVSNANISAVTHIPKAAILINFTAEFNLLRKTITQASDGIPLGYYTADGSYYDISVFDASDINYGHLLVPTSELNNENQPAIYSNFHMNLSKDIGKRLTCSFHVYNVFNYRPRFQRSDSNAIIIPNAAPSYGAQLTFKL